MVFKGFSYLINVKGDRYNIKDVSYEFNSKEELIENMNKNFYKFIGDNYSVGDKENCLAFGCNIGYAKDKMVIIDSIGTWNIVLIYF